MNCEEEIGDKAKKLSSVCDECGKSFTNIYTLNSHKKIVHEKIKNFTCNLNSCGKSFSTKHKLERHKQGKMKEIIKMN